MVDKTHIQKDLTLFQQDIKKALLIGVSDYKKKDASGDSDLKGVPDDINTM